MRATSTFAEKRRILQLETLYDLALALHADRPEADLVEELLQRVCTVLDPAAAVAVTRNDYGGAQAVASVGWHDVALSGDALLRHGLWRDLLAEGQPLRRRDGELVGRPFREILATPLQYRNVYLGYLALLDKETRGGDSAFSDEDRRFLDSVASLAGVALDNARQLVDLETQRDRLEEENKALKGQLTNELPGQRIIANSQAMQRVLEMIERIAPRSVNVLLRGESGTGKELIAKLTHVHSGRSGALVAVNCAALPESLLESELFGIARGVATGVDERRGKFELADGGTLFLDEIGDLDLPLQVKLLRALQEREVTPVGSDKAIPVDVRVIAATHRDLVAAIDRGAFRGDLYYRLKGVEIELPPLRRRRSEIPFMVRYFTERFCEAEGMTPPPFTTEALALLLDYGYPGNVRELQNLVEGAVSLADSTIDVDLLRGLMDRTDAPDAPSPAVVGDVLELRAVESRHIEHVLRLTGGNKSAAARMLGLDRRTLQRKGF